MIDEKLIKFETGDYLIENLLESGVVAEAMQVGAHGEPVGEVLRARPLKCGPIFSSWAASAIRLRIRARAALPRRYSCLSCCRIEGPPAIFKTGFGAASSPIAL